MTPKEKAKELINKFKHSESQDGSNDVRAIYAAIRCALIAVDQILEIIYSNYDWEYWLEVKKDIEKL